MPQAKDINALAGELASCKSANRDLDARVAVALYSDTGHDDDRDNTHARLPSKIDECAPGTYWISAFSGLSLRTAPDFTGDKLLRGIAVFALQASASVCRWCNGNGWYRSNSGGFAQDRPCDYCNPKGLSLAALRTEPSTAAETVERVIEQAVREHQSIIIEPMGDGLGWAATATDTEDRVWHPLNLATTPADDTAVLLRGIIDRNFAELDKLPCASPFARYLRAMNASLDAALSRRPG